VARLSTQTLAKGLLTHSSGEENSMAQEAGVARVAAKRTTSGSTAARSATISSIE
jgi:hypothetical protein